MTELGDIMGDDFEEEYKEKADRARSNASKVDQATMMEICYEAINNDGFKGSEPRFRFSAEGVDHDVLLMESPDTDLDTFRWPLGDTAKTQGMFHVDQLFSLAFQENMLDLLDKIEVGEYYVVAGRYKETTRQNGDGTEDTYYNINPVRGIVPLSVAKKYADKYEDQLDSTSVEEQSKQQKSESSSSSGGISLDGDSDESDEVTDDDIISIFRAIGDDSKESLERVAGGDSEMIEKLVKVTKQHLEGDAEEDRILDVFEDNVSEIEGRGEDEDEEDIGFDLGGDDSESETESEPEPEPEPDTGEDSSEDTSEDPSDWF